MEFIPALRGQPQGSSGGFPAIELHEHTPAGDLAAVRVELEREDGEPEEASE
jgi:hypothetical protein